MMRQDSGGMPHLVVLAPDSNCGRRIPPDMDYLVARCGPTCDARFDDQHVGRTHITLWRCRSAVYVQDVDSSGGTFVNDAA
jgi:pSer/pThr/pTyr-binding forkhead associated (FHA) protein